VLGLCLLLTDGQVRQQYRLGRQLVAVLVLVVRVVVGVVGADNVEAGCCCCCTRSCCDCS